jgi:hypothetical protein
MMSAPSQNWAALSTVKACASKFPEDLNHQMYELAG